MDAFNQSFKKTTFVPLLSQHPAEFRNQNERMFISVLESLYWQTIGWVHTPSFIKAKLDSGLKVETPKSTVESEKYQFHTKKSFEPKLQIEDKVPYGVLPKDVVVDLKRRRVAEQDLKTILTEMDIEPSVILPSVVIYKNEIVILKNEYTEGIPMRPFLELDMFDDATLYDAYSSEEWLLLGDTEEGRKPLPAVAFVPIEESHVSECFIFDWHRVNVLDYDRDRKLFLIRRVDLNCEDPESLFLDDDSRDIWIHRIYLKFEAEEPLQFAKRLHTALSARHAVEESLRLNYYVECMPLEDSPGWCKADLDSIITTARRSRTLQPKLQWIKDHLTNNIIREMQQEYKRAYNSLCYTEIAQQNPRVCFKNERLVDNIYQFDSNVELGESFKEIFESFRCSTFYTCVEAVQALCQVESNMLALRDLSLYNLQFNKIYTLEIFEAFQRTELRNISKYIHGTWLTDISNAISFHLKKLGKGSYDVNQTVLHTFKFTKLGKLLKMITFKMQDVLRFLVVESLEKYSTAIKLACSNVIDIKDNFVWNDSLSSNELSPPGNPIFEVPLEIKGDRLQFVVDLKKYGDTVRDLFEEGLRVTKNIPRIEKFVMKKMLYNPDDKLDSVREKEKNVFGWKMDISRGMDRAIVAATAYISAYDVPLKSFKTDQINYVKQFARSKANCEQLKQVIEMHNTEKKSLENTIPSFVDIGPFRLMTKSVRTAAIKKHEQLADAVLGYFYKKLRQFMEEINNQFLMLLDRIEQPTGNIEDLLDKKQWCRTVPKKIERLSAEVNQLRSDVKLISTFNRNMEDEDFNTFWQVQKLPQETMKRLQSRLSVFEGERSQHREHLTSDQEKLKTNLDIIRTTIAQFVHHSEVEKAPAVATEVRKARKSLAKFDEQSQLYQKREHLFGLPLTDYSEIVEICEMLAPYESFWLSTAEFKKYKEREDSELLTIEPTQLREAIEEFQSSLQESLEYFTEESHPAIYQSVISVLEEVQEFKANRLS